MKYRFAVCTSSRGISSVRFEQFDKVERIHDQVDGLISVLQSEFIIPAYCWCIQIIEGRGTKNRPPPCKCLNLEKLLKISDNFTSFPTIFLVFFSLLSFFCCIYGISMTKFINLSEGILQTSKIYLYTFTR